VLERAEKPIKLGIMVREPIDEAAIGCSKFKGAMTVIERTF